MSVTLLLIVLGLLALTMLNAHRQVSASTMSVYVHIRPGTPQYDIAPLKQALNKAPYAGSYTFTTADRILASEINDDNREAIELIGENPYTDEFEIKINHAWLQPDSLSKIEKALSAFPFVEDVVVPSLSIARSVSSGLSRIALTTLAFAALLLVISIALINNTVSLSIYSRRFIIHTMKLVGATRSYIRRPFVKAGAAAGAIAATLASAAICAVYSYLSHAMPDMVSSLSWADIACVCVASLLLSVTVCAATAWCAANRYLNKNYDRLFMK